jgi:iron complex transport system substrate-binding protein
MQRSRHRLVAAIPALALAALVAACGGAAAPEPAPPPAASEDAAPAPDDAFPLTLEVGGATVTISARPERIVSLSPSSTEGLFAIGAGDAVVAADEYSDFPAEAPTTDLSGITPNLEAIAAYEPDLVIASFDPGDLVTGMAALGVPVLVLDAPADLEGALEQLELLGRATGEVAAATAAIDGLRARLDAVVASLPDAADGLTYYHELDDTFFTVTSSTFVGEVHGLLGLVSIADAADPDGAAFGYPQLSPEYVLEADPDLVFLADTRCCDVTAESFAARPGFSELTAVREGRVIELDDDVASRWGPRIVDLVEAVAAAVTAATGPGA